VKIKAFFRHDAAFINVRFVSPSFQIDETIEFLIDTGATKTVLLDKGALFLQIDYTQVPPYEYNVSGIGGTVRTYVIKDNLLIFKSHSGELKLSLPILLLQHPLDKMDEKEKYRILRLPSLLGRDVIKQFLIFDYHNEHVYLQGYSLGTP
jgi:hypothetical protein